MIDTEDLPAQEADAQKRPSLVVIIVCAFLSVVFTKIGFLSVFFLAPVGYAVLICNSLWLPFISAASVNAGFLIILRLFFRGSAGNMPLEILYFTTLFLGFAFIMGGDSLRGAYRFVLASAAGTVVFLIYISGSGSGFYAGLYEMSQMLAQVFVNSADVDPARRSLLQQLITPERALEAVKIFLLRGGALLSTSFVFFINRQVSISLVSIIKRQRKDRGLTAFFAPSFTIWVLSGALAVIWLTRLFRIQILEILAWNILVICAILFFAQGAGIFLHFLARRTYFFRFFAVVLVVMAILSPGLNMIAVSAILLLGIAENWLPFRAPKKGPASTPEP
jgi:hypothetical protein